MTDLDFKPDSSNIKRVQFKARVGAEKGVLLVRFNSGMYAYDDVPVEVAQEFLVAESAGNYFAANIRDQYRANKVEKDPDNMVKDPEGEKE